MKSPDLVQLAKEIELESEALFSLRVQFGLACIERVEHLITDGLIRDTLSTGKAYVTGECNELELNKAAVEAANLSRSHPGSGSIDGTGSAAVSTSRGLVAALAGRALEAAGYAAYASVYAYASYAVTDLSAYSSEHRWQVSQLKLLAEERAIFLPDAGDR